jgi:hypothetical protein
MSDDDAFEKIINNQPEEEDPENYRKYIVQGFRMYFPGVLRGGVLVMDVLDEEGERELMWLTEPTAPRWEVKGYAQQVIDDLGAENLIQIWHAIHEEPETDDGEGTTDE